MTAGYKPYQSFKGVIILILLLFSLVSCKTTRMFTIDILEPADIIVPQHINHLVIAHNAFPQRSDKRNIPYQIYGSLYYDTTFHHPEIARAGMEQLAGILNFNRRFTAAASDTVIMLPTSPNDFTNRHIATLKNPCLEYDAEAVIFLSEMDVGINYSIHSSYLGSSISIFEVLLNKRWLFIDPFEPELIDQRLIRDTLYYRIDGFYGTSDPVLYQTGRELLEEAAAESAFQYAWRITPHLVEASRIVFRSGNRDIRRGYKMAVEGDWLKAADHWRSAHNDSNIITRARAAFNLALAAEMEGLLNAALMWAERSYELFPDELNETYVNILRRRIMQQDDILIQLEGY